MGMLSRRGIRLARAGFPDDAIGMANDWISGLRDALRRRLDVVADRALYQRDAAAHLAQLREASAELERLGRSLPDDADPVLRHYLERQSYVKALDWLDAQPVQR
jgi:hypothetical protein